MIYRELLSAALPGQPAKQAQRMLVSMLEAIEPLVTSTEAPPYLRVQGCGSSHRTGDFEVLGSQGIEPNNHTVTAAETRAF